MAGLDQHVGLAAASESEARGEASHLYARPRAAQTRFHLRRNRQSASYILGIEQLADIGGSSDEMPIMDFKLSLSMFCEMAGAWL
jgi:hypothetical protein